MVKLTFKAYKKTDNLFYNFIYIYKIQKKGSWKVPKSFWRRKNENRIYACEHCQKEEKEKNGQYGPG